MKINIKKFDFKKIIGYFNLDSEMGKEIRIFRDWKIILICFFLFLAVVFLANFYILRESQKDLYNNFVPEGKVLTIQRNSIKEIIEEISKRESKSNDALIMPAPNDPSL